MGAPGGDRSAGWARTGTEAPSPVVPVFWPAEFRRAISLDRSVVANGSIGMMNLVEKAEQLIQEGKLDQAKEVLMEALRVRPSDKRLCQDAVGIFLYGEMYDEAKNVFQLYRDQTGKALDGDFSLKEVESLSKGALEAREHYAQSDVKIFKRMSFQESSDQRGHVTNWLSPRSEIRIYPDRIGVREWGKERTYPWSAITRATLTRNPVRTEEVKFLEKKLCVKAGKKSILDEEDITVYKHSDILLQELKKHCQLEEIQPKKQKRFPL